MFSVYPFEIIVLDMDRLSIRILGDYDLIQSLNDMYPLGALVRKLNKNKSIDPLLIFPFFERKLLFFSHEIVCVH